MAARYWVGGASTWDATAGSKWALTSGGTGGQAVPTSSDDVFLDNGTGHGNVTASAGCTCKTFICTGYVGTLTMTTSITVAGDVTLVSGMTIAAAGADLILNGTGTFTAAGKSLNSIQIGAATITITGDVIATGTTTSNSYSAAINGAFNWKTASLTIGNNLNGSATIVMNGTGTWSGGAALRCNLVFNSAGTITVSGTQYFGGGSLSITYTAGTMSMGTSLVYNDGVAIMNTSGMTFANYASSNTLTLSSNLNVSGTYTNTGVAINGAFTINTGSLTISGTTSGNGSIVMNNTGTWSGAGTLCNNLTFNGVGKTFTISGTVNYGGGTITYTAGTVTVTSSTLAFVSGVSTVNSTAVFNIVAINGSAKVIPTVFWPTKLTSNTNMIQGAVTNVSMFVN